MKTINLLLSKLKIFVLFTSLLASHKSSQSQVISGGEFHTISVCSNGTAKACGRNDYGQLGDGTTTDKTTPVQVIELSGIRAVSGGYHHSLFLKNNGTVWACGKNGSGQLGDGTLINKTTPVQVSGLSGITAIAAGDDHSLFLKNDGTVWACGANFVGQLGDDLTNYKTTPGKISGLSGIVDITGGNQFSLFLKNDGTVWACGYNGYGQLGDGTTNNKTYPVPISGLSGIISISAGYHHSLFLKNDGTVWACGENNAGRLGDGTTIDKITPVQVSGLSGITSVSGGTLHSLFLKSDGTVWACGGNLSGQYGDGTTISKSIPIQINSLSEITTVSAGGYHSLFLKNDGTVWACGYNFEGQSGDGTTGQKTIPAQVNNMCFVFKHTQGVWGYVYNDINNNCVKDSESGIGSRFAHINPGNLLVQTNGYGYWYLDSLPEGNYTITVDSTSGNWQPTCSVTQSFTVINSDSLTHAPDFGFLSTNPCAEPDVSLFMPFIRRGFSNQKIYINSCNAYSATGALNAAYTDLELDELLTVDSASVAYTDLGNNIFRFQHGDLNPGQCASFLIYTTVSLGAVINQTLCMDASLFPADSCMFDTIPSEPADGISVCTLPWDKSSIKVEGWCENDSIYFIVTNTGDFGQGDMQCYAPLRLYIDGQYILLDSVLLLGGEIDTLVFSGDGRTWRLEVDQHPLHPGNSHPNATVELCGNAANWTARMVDILPMNDADPIVDIYCGIVRASYDPNDKTGYPLGVDEEHNILPNGEMQYVIRFQNTGTDTAFTIVVRDTLDVDFNIFTVKSGVSSHDYDFTMYGSRILQWTFSNILLPDSSTNQEGSNGFVTFTVKQNPNLPDGTELNNKVGIYFDFNEPVITNTTSHIIDRGIKSKPNNITKNVSIANCEEVSVNGIAYQNSGSYFQLLDGGANLDTLLVIESTVLQPSFSQTTEANCNDFTWTDGNTYTESGTYSQLLINAEGCDSTATLVLTVGLDTSITVNGSTLSSNVVADSYQWLDCANNFAAVSGANAATFVPTETGIFALSLEVNSCADTSSCYYVYINSSKELEDSYSLKAIPNPTSGKINLISNVSLNGAQVVVFNSLGEKVFVDKILNSTPEIDLSALSSGVYFIQVKQEKEERYLRVVKE